MTSTGSLEVLSVFQLNRRARKLLESHFSTVWVEGEISNFKHHSSGHMYFVLKDDRAEMAGVMFASDNVSLTFNPANGQKVLARGQLTLYETRGQYQLVVQNLYAAGAGELWAAFEALKERLRREGLFDPERKKSLPSFPRRIGVVTSPTGAAIRDIIQIFSRRAPQVTLVIRPTLVQGEDAADDITAAVGEFAAYGRVDLLILTRGGGSLEDLWPFNEERVARAVANCPLPTLSAVGHETDMTICDLVADQRAPTPSAAAELAVDERDRYLQFLDEQLATLERVIQRRFQSVREQIDQLRQRYAFRQPLVLIEQQKERLHQLDGELKRGMVNLIDRKSQALQVVFTGLHALNPKGVLQRGYAIVADDLTGQVMTHLRQLSLNQALRLHMQDGDAGAEVTRLDNPVAEG
ncbi:MAG: exodeoxyribonuclease VII large subunit [Fidelibacterota bacterium]|nr:MAG: exodeoxyribonuclease VII large subunit [Candidatus Neomarinimicrobiota bacterium]